MDTKKTTAYYVGIWLTVLSVGLCALFLALRLLGVIAWSWWWVFAPVAVPFVVVFAVVLLAQYLISTQRAAERAHKK